jgi:hypothetical protein
MHATYEVVTTATAAPNGSTIAVDAHASDGTDLSRLPRRMPAAIPADQLYFWTRAWQEGEAAALADLEAGRSRVFNDPGELARYLLRPAD